MRTNIEIEGKSMAVEVTDEAATVLRSRSQALLAEIELYFSCLIRKQVRFRETEIPVTAKAVTDNLVLTFRPVMTKACGKDYEGDEPPLTEFPIENTRPYVPRWVKIDFRSGQWHGEFGYD
jgi:hypothetical protein